MPEAGDKELHELDCDLSTSASAFTKHCALPPSFLPLIDGGKQTNE